MRCRDKYYWGMFRLAALSDKLGGLKPIHYRHIDIHQDYRNLLVEQIAERIFSRCYFYQLMLGIRQYRFQRKEILKLIINQKNIEIIINNLHFLTRPLFYSHPTIDRMIVIVNDSIT